MNIKLTEEEIEAILIDVSHVLDKCALKKEHKESRQSLLSKLKPQPTREELTAKWVKDNNIVVGSKVKVVEGFADFAGITKGDYDKCIGTIGVVEGINAISIHVRLSQKWAFPIESLEPYKEEYIPYIWEDRNLFRGKWVRWIREEKEFMVDIIMPEGLCFDNHLFPYQDLLKRLEFIDKTPFGKLP